MGTLIVSFFMLVVLFVLHGLGSDVLPQIQRRDRSNGGDEEGSGALDDVVNAT